MVCMYVCMYVSMYGWMYGMYVRTVCMYVRVLCVLLVCMSFQTCLDTVISMACLSSLMDLMD